MEIRSTTSSIQYPPVRATRSGREGRASAQDEKTAVSLFRNEDPPPPKVGFGEDSVKVPGLAVTTIRRNLREAKKLVPTVEESQVRVRQRVQKDAERVQVEVEDEVAPAFDLGAGRSRAIAETRQFVNALNTTAGRALERVGAVPSGKTNRLDVRIGDVAIPFDSPAARPPLDLFA